VIRSHSRLSRRSSADLRAIERATKRIEELSTILDRQLKGDARPEEQLKHLRQATGQITRSANDGIQAYRRVSQALRAEAEHADADQAEVTRATQNLADARARMLAALETASQRYPWAAPWGSLKAWAPRIPDSERPGGNPAGSYRCLKQLAP
jgi:hypothetical protein